MKRLLLILSGFISLHTASGQNPASSYLGLNILQLPASTINANYSIQLSPLFSPQLEIGYAINYVPMEDVDLPGKWLTSHLKKEDEWTRYEPTRQSGGYLKLGGHYNVRTTYEKLNFFHIGVFLTSSFVNEKAMKYEIYPITRIPYEVKQQIFLFGVSIAGGYEFAIGPRLKSNVDFQISLPEKKYVQLFGYKNFIPGMGFKDNESGIFPMLIWNMKYPL